MPAAQQRATTGNPLVPAAQQQALNTMQGGYLGGNPFFKVHLKLQLLALKLRTKMQHKQHYPMLVVLVAMVLVLWVLH